MATAKVLVVAGWWGGWYWRWGWGGGGGVLYDAALSISVGAIAVTVGNGWGNNAQGSNSVFSSLASIWGWRWGGEPWYGISPDGWVWWSGGWGIAKQSTYSYLWGAWTSWQWYAGWNWVFPENVNYLAWGGWGAGWLWINGSTANWGNGGIGYTSSISWTSVNYAWGGGGSWNGGTPGTWTDGGGNGTVTSGATGWAGTANRWGWGGGGAGTASRGLGGAWGSGIVIISYSTDWSDWISNTSTGGTVTTSGGQTIHTFTTDWTFTAVASTPSTNNGAWMLMFFYI